MKRRAALILTAVLSASMILGACGGAASSTASVASSEEPAVTEAPAATPTPEPTKAPDPTATPTPEPTATPIPLKTIGEKTENSKEIILANNTGAVITGITVKREDDEDYADNFLTEEDPFDIDEQRVLYFPVSTEEFVAPEAAEGEGAIPDALLIPEYTVQLTTKSVPEAEGEEGEEKVFVLHAFPVDDVADLSIKVDEESGLAYIEYESISSNQKISTLEMEKAIEQARLDKEAADKAAAEKAAAEQAAAEEAAAQAAAEEAAAAEAAAQAQAEAEAQWAAEQAAAEQAAAEAAAAAAAAEAAAQQEGCVTDGLLNP